MLLAIHFAIVVFWCLPINLNTKYGWDENTNIFLTGAKECKQTIVQSCVCVRKKCAHVIGFQFMSNSRVG